MNYNYNPFSCPPNCPVEFSEQVSGTELARNNCFSCGRQASTA
jgi:hypothetical protein